MSGTQVSIVGRAVDENGQPLIILKEEEQKQRQTGMEAQLSNILACTTLSNSISSSFGPKGMDKIIVDKDGQSIVTNDGATILREMGVSHRVARILVDLSCSQDAEIGDGTTGVIIMAGALLGEAGGLLNKKLHALSIADGFDKACELAVDTVTKCAFKEDLTRETLIEIAKTALGSKVVNKYKQKLAEIAVDAILVVRDEEREMVNFDMINIMVKPGGHLSETALIYGLVLDKEMSHPQMPKNLEDVSVAILTCPFEPPKPKNKHRLDVTSRESYEELHRAEQDYFISMVDKLQEVGTGLAICQWGFDDEANHLLYSRGIPAVRWVGGGDLETLAIATKARIVPRFEELTADKLGHVKNVRELSIGTDADPILVFEQSSSCKAVTIVIRGGNRTIIDEAKRCVHDALCCIRNALNNPLLIAGGGSSELAASLEIEKLAETVGTAEQYAIRSFARALEKIPHALAANSGLAPLDVVADLKYLQTENNCPYLGVDCMQVGNMNMREQKIFELLSSKVSQFRMMTQVVRMILKIDDVIAPGE